MIMKENMEDLAMLYAIGARDGKELEYLRRLLNEHDPEATRLVHQWNDVMTTLSLASDRTVRPAERVRHELMRAIQTQHATERSTEGPGSARFEHARGISTIYPDRLEWQKHPVPGVSFKVLSENKKRGYVTMLMKVEPRTVFPAHHHSGEEECYILSGSIILNGKRLGAGVLHHGDEDSEHDVLSTDEGALLLLVVAREDYIPTVGS